MKKLVLFSALVMALLCYAAISTADKATEEQEAYDEDTYGPEAPIVWSQPVKGVTFSHSVHTQDAGLDCESCHDDLFEMEAGSAEANDDFNMASMADGLYCGACHDDSTAFSVNSQCGSCHRAPEELIVWTKPVKTVIFDHRNHTEENGLECTSCHDDLFVMKAGSAEEQEDFTMKALYDGNYCGACHDGSTAFASNTRCTTCHIGSRGYARMLKDKNGSPEDTEH